MIQRHYRRRFTAWAVLLLLLSVLTMPASARLQILVDPAQVALHAPGVREDFVYTPQPLGSQFTIRSVAAVDGSATPAEGGASLWLAGVSTGVGEAPTSLAMTWATSSTSSSWWGAVWELQLHSGEGLLPVELTEGITGTRGKEIAILASANPVPGHKYESLMSYDSSTGALSLRFTDLTEDRVVYQGTLTAGRSSDALFAATGVDQAMPGENRRLFSVESVETYPLYLPIGIHWAAGLSLPNDQLMPMFRFERNERVGLQLRTGRLLTGRLQILSVTDQATRELARIQPSEPLTSLNLPATDLPIGDSQLQIDYVENGVTLLRDVADIAVGRSLFHFSDISLDRTQGLLTNQVAVSSAGAIPGSDVSIKAQLDEIVWNEEKRTYELRPVAATTLFQDTMDIPNEALMLPLEMSVPQRPGFWQVTFEPVVTPDVAIQAARTQQRFVTYSPAAPEPGEPFTIAFVPDTQYHNRIYPEVFTRQLQWLAEQAQERNIVLTTLLGDITDNNTRDQWERAAQTIGMLDGVMPFVLAQGNHDMTQAGGSVSDRDHSLINEYFPLEKQPWITGTFEEGRVENSYSLFAFQDVKYLILSLEFGPRNEVLAWANEVVAQHPDYRVIMITHNYTAGNGGRSNSALNYDIANNPATSVNAGPGMWSNLVQLHANFQLVVSGHIHSNAIPRQVALGRNRNWVYEMLIDYQSDPMGGNGYFVLMTFNPDGTIEVRAYSPYLSQDRTMLNQYGHTNHFIIDTENGRFLNP